MPYLLFLFRRVAQNVMLAAKKRLGSALVRFSFVRICVISWIVRLGIPVIRFTKSHETH